MFEDLLNEIEELGRSNISVPIDADKEGYLDRECPNADCLFQFKVNEQDWKDIFQDEVIYCPLCRHEAGSNSWWTTEQLEYAEEEARKHILGRIDNAMVRSAKRFNASQPRKSFIKMSMTVKGSNPYHYILPIPAKEEMQLKIQCKNCNAKYAVIGSAFFCPCCGHNSAEETFDNSLLKIENKLKNIPIIKKAVEAISKDEAETTCRSLIESSLSECVVAFQRFCEVTYSKKAPEEKLKFNAFQNIGIGANYWQNLYGESYQQWLTDFELKKLNELFQKRHLLAHSEGIVDQKYIDKSKDSSYKVGQRIVIKEKDIIQLLELIKKIVNIVRQK